MEAEIHTMRSRNLIDFGKSLYTYNTYKIANLYSIVA